MITVIITLLFVASVLRTTYMLRKAYKVMCKGGTIITLLTSIHWINYIPIVNILEFTIVLTIDLFTKPIK